MNFIDKLFFDLSLDKEYLAKIISRSSFYYKDFTIPKSNGGIRHISQPSPELKTLQYWVLENILSNLPVSSSAYAYKKGDSIKKHALLHSKSRFILHTDISDFFETINSSKLISILNNKRNIFKQLDLDYDESVEYIKKICFRKDKLCIGAVSSPAISNIIMYSFDNVLAKYCDKRGYKYSRYADDIYISSNEYIDAKILVYIDKELSKRGFTINKSKTRFFSPKYKRCVTGIVLTNDSNISIGTKRRILIKKMIYNKLVNGIGDSNVILGYLSFLKDVEPNTYEKLIIKYSKYCNSDVLTALREHN